MRKSLLFVLLLACLLPLSDVFGVIVVRESVTIRGNSDRLEVPAAPLGAELTIVLSEAEILVSEYEKSPAIRLLVGSRVRLELEGSSVLRGGYMNAGIEVPDGAELVITTRSGGSLDVSTAGYASGIGASRAGTCGRIFIDKGTVTARGDWNSAGIGGGVGGGNIEITGGSVTAVGTRSSAGIGLGELGGRILIRGGVVRASGSGCADIGLGSFPSGVSGYSVTIDGGDVGASVISGAVNSAGLPVYRHEVDYALGYVDGLDVRLVSDSPNASLREYSLHDVPSGGRITVWSPVEPPLLSSSVGVEGVTFPVIDLSDPDAEVLAPVSVEVLDEGVVGSLGGGPLRVSIVNAGGSNSQPAFSVPSVFTEELSGGGRVFIPVTSLVTPELADSFAPGRYFAELLVEGRSGSELYIPLFREIKKTSVRTDNIAVRMLEYDNVAQSYKPGYVSSTNPVIRTFGDPHVPALKLKAVDTEIKNPDLYIGSYFWYTSWPTDRGVSSGLLDWINGKPNNTPSKVLKKRREGGYEEMTFDIIGAGRARVELRAYDKMGWDFGVLAPPSDEEFGGFLDDWSAEVPTDVQYVEVLKGPNPDPIRIHATIDGGMLNTAEVRATVGTILEVTSTGGNVGHMSAAVKYEVIAETPSGMLVEDRLSAMGIGIPGRGDHYLMWYHVMKDGTAVISVTLENLDNYVGTSDTIVVTVSQGQLTSAVPLIVAAGGASTSSSVAVGTRAVSGAVPVTSSVPVIPSVERGIANKGIPASGVTGVAGVAGVTGVAELAEASEASFVTRAASSSVSSSDPCHAELVSASPDYSPAALSSSPVADPCHPALVSGSPVAMRDVLVEASGSSLSALGSSSVSSSRRFLHQPVTFSTRAVSSAIPSFTYAGVPIEPLVEVSLPAPAYSSEIVDSAAVAGIALPYDPYIIPSSHYAINWVNNHDVTSSGTYAVGRIDALPGGSFVGSVPDPVSFSITPAPLLISVRDTVIGGIPLPDRSHFHFDPVGLVGRDRDTISKVITGLPEFKISTGVGGDGGADTVSIVGGISVSPNYTTFYRPGVLRSTSPVIRPLDESVTHIVSVSSDEEISISFISNESGSDADRAGVSELIRGFAGYAGGSVSGGISGSVSASVYAYDGGSLSFVLTLPVGFRPVLGGISSESVGIYPSSTVDLDGKYWVTVSDISSALSLSVSLSAGGEPGDATGNDLKATVRVPVVNVYSNGSTLYLSVPAPTSASIYTLSGTLVRSLPLSLGTTCIRLSPGLYLVVIDSVSYKVSIK